jgi:ribosomal protein S6
LKTYQALFIFSSSLADDAIQDILKNVQGEVEKLGGTVTTSELTGKKVFARPMKKMETGNYAKVIMQLAPSAVAPLQARLKLNENIFRVQIVEFRAPVVESPKAAAPVEATGSAG